MAQVSLTQIIAAPQSLWTNEVPTNMQVFDDLSSFSIAPKTYGTGTDLVDESTLNKNKVDGKFGNGFFYTHSAPQVSAWIQAMGKNNPNGVQTFSLSDINTLVDTYIVGQAPSNAKFIIVDFEPANPSADYWMWDYSHPDFQLAMYLIAQRISITHNKYFYDWISAKFTFTFNGENYNLDGENNDGFANNLTSINNVDKLLAVHRNIPAVTNLKAGVINQVGIGYTAPSFNPGINGSGVLPVTKWQGIENMVLKSIDGHALKNKLGPSIKTVGYYWPLEDKPVANPGRISNIYTKFKPNSITNAYPQNLNGKVTVTDNRTPYPSNIIEDTVLFNLCFPDLIHDEYWLHGGSYNPYAQIRYSSINGSPNSCMGGSFKTGNYQGSESSLPCPSDLPDYIGTENRTVSAYIKAHYRYGASGIKDVLNGTQVAEFYQFQYKRFGESSYNTSVFENHTGQAALAFKHSQPLLWVWVKPSTGERVIIFWDLFADAYAPTDFKIVIGSNEYTGSTKGNRSYTSYLASAPGVVTTTVPVTTTVGVTTTVSGSLNPAIRPFSERKVVWNFDGLTGVMDSGLYDAVKNRVQVISYLNFEWGQIERTQGIFNYDEIDWLLWKLNLDGLKTILWFKTQIPTGDALSGWDTHDKVSNGVYTRFQMGAAGTKYLPDSSYDIDRYGIKVNGNGYNFNIKASFAYHNIFARTSYFNFVARVCNYINNHPLKGVIEGIGLLDGGLGETAFELQNRQGTGHPTPVTDSGYHDDNIAAYRVFLGSTGSGRYANIAALNSSWGTSFGSFADINRGNMPKTADMTFDMTYNEGNGQRDWYRFKAKTHRDFYIQFCNVVKNPSSQVGGLASNTGFNTFAYVSENFSSGQGRTYGIALMKYMYEMFDCYLSSVTSGGGPDHTNSFLGDVQLRNMLFLGTFGNKPRGQEQDGDPVDRNTGQSRTAKCIFNKGAKYSVVALQTEASHWERNVLSDDNITRKYKDDVLRTRDVYCIGQSPSSITPDVTLTYFDADILISPHNPTNVVSAWKTATNIDSNSNGDMSQVVAINCISNFV
jgi:hypothetical protein